MSGDFSLLSLAREHTDNDRTHWHGCERLHRECLIQRMADEIERLNKLIATAAETGDYYEEKLSAAEARVTELETTNRSLETMSADLLARAEAAERDAERLDALEDLVNHGDCPGIVNDDNGHWAVSGSGLQTVVCGDVPQDVQTTFFIDANQWRDTIREAIDVYLADAAKSKSNETT